MLERSSCHGMLNKPKAVRSSPSAVNGWVISTRHGQEGVSSYLREKRMAVANSAGHNPESHAKGAAGKCAQDATGCDPSMNPRRRRPPVHG